MYRIISIGLGLAIAVLMCILYINEEMIIAGNLSECVP